MLMSGLGILFIAAWLVLNIHNISLYTPDSGFDAPDHIKYIKYIQNNTSLPIPAQGWEMYHPPLYYLIMAFIPGIKLGQYLNFILVMILIFLIFIFLKKKYQDYRFGFLGIAFCLSLPVIIQTIPQVNNEVLLTILVSIGLVFYYFTQKKLNRRNSVIIGLISGLCLLTKYTGILFLISVIVDIIIKRHRSLKYMIKPVVIILITTFALSGWVYLKNFILYRNPFISNIDLFHTEQIPKSRNISFLTNTTAFLNKDYYNSRYYSFWGGVYFSFFHDEQNAIIPSSYIGKTDPGLITKPIGIILLIFAGFIYTVFKKRHDQVFALYFFLIMAAFIYYCFKYPTATSVKGMYILSTITPLCVFGLNLIRKYRIDVYFVFGYLLLYCWIVFKNFWILNSWL